MSYLYNHQSNNSKIVFFFGAGASVDAGLFGVVRLVNELKQWLESNSQIDYRFMIEAILSTLRKFKHDTKDESDIDIELLLETVERIENKYNDVLQYFYENKNPRLERHQEYSSVFNSNSKLSTEIRLFIKDVFSNRQISTEYLNPLKDFITVHGPLPIFSTNYDICVERFCKDNGKHWIDGFNPYWNPDLEYRRKGVDVRLYKLHGSVTWYRSETGDYVRSDVLTVRDTTTSVAEKPLVPLILYPGRKLQYIEPIIYLLRELEEQIKNIKYMFVIGYSFKDDHIARLFRYAATKNRELIVFLVSPSASIIYNQKLKYHNDEEFLKSFTVHSFSIKSFTRPVQSDLCGRVICLNYKFKKIFPFLKDGYLKHLIEAEELESSAKYDGSETEKNTWKDQLRHYIDCEHMDKVNEKINDIGWNKILSDDWRFSFEISFKGLLDSLISDDNDIKNKWPKYFEEVGRIFSIDKFIYQPSLGGPSASFLPHIKLELRNTYGNITIGDLAKYLQETVVPVIQQKLKIVSDGKYNTINEFLDRINALINYLHLWRGEDMTFNAYYLKRSQDHSDKMEYLRKKVDQFLNFQRNETGQQEVRNLIEKIETIELLKIYGANTLLGNFSLVRLMGYLSTHR